MPRISFIVFNNELNYDYKFAIKGLLKNLNLKIIKIV